MGFESSSKFSAIPFDLLTTNILSHASFFTEASFSNYIPILSFFPTFFVSSCTTAITLVLLLL